MPYREPPDAPALSGVFRTLWEMLWWHLRWWHGDRLASWLGHLLCAAVVLVAPLPACSSATLQVESRVADGVAVAGNTALPILVERYRDEGIDAILAVKHAGGSADEARAAVDAVKARWAPVWTAWDALAAAQDGWATAIEQGGDASAALGGLKAAYCSLLFSWPKDVPAAPLAPISCGERP